MVVWEYINIISYLPPFSGLVGVAVLSYDAEIIKVHSVMILLAYAVRSTQEGINLSATGKIGLDKCVLTA